jgi:hypothetical protein
MRGSLDRAQGALSSQPGGWEKRRFVWVECSQSQEMLKNEEGPTMCMKIKDIDTLSRT